MLAAGQWLQKSEMLHAVFSEVPASGGDRCLLEQHPLNSSPCMHRGVFIHLSAAPVQSGNVHTLSVCFIKSDTLLCRCGAQQAARSGFQIR